MNPDPANEAESLGPDANTSNSPEEEDRFTAVLEAYMAALEAGEAPDRDSLLAQHPGLAEELARRLDTLDFIHRVAPQLQEPEEGVDDVPGFKAPPAGTLGDFRILREVGRGGMGVVYEAEQISLKRRVALKVLPFAAVMDGRRLQRFKNEAQAAASLTYPGIVHVYSVGCERGVHYYAMQYIEGQTLADIIHDLRLLTGGDPESGKRGRQPPGADTVSWLAQDRAKDRPADETETATPSTASTARGRRRDREFFRTVARFGMQAAQALEHAHRTGIVHRDIKPSNLMIDADRRLWITDFGLAMSKDSQLTMTGDMVGTLRYMSPEQLEGDRGVLDHRTDIYSLGVTLYELLALRPAAPANDRHEVIHQITESDPPRLRRLDPGVPQDLETIVLKAMSKAPEARYATAGEFADDLGRYLQHRPILARRPSLATKVANWSRRHQPVLWSAFITLALTAIVLGVSTFLVSRAYQKESEQRVLAEQREERLRQHLYAADVKLAHQAWKTADVAAAVALLEKHRPEADEEDLRGFEWYYVWALCHPDLTTLEGHTGEVYFVAFSPDGKTLASTGEDGTIRLWDVATRRSTAVLTGHVGDVNGVAFSPDGQTLASAGDDATVRLWNVTAGKVVATCVGHSDEVFAVAFSPDGRLLASGGCDDTVKLWNARSGENVATLRGHTNDVESLVFSPDGKILVTAGHDALRKWNPADGTSQGAMTEPTGAFCVAISPQGEWAATGHKDGAVFLWNYPGFTGPVAVGRHTQWVQSVAFSPNGRLLASASKDGTVRLWDVATRKSIRVLRGHLGRVWSVAFSPDGTTIATAGADGTVKLWDVQSHVEYEAIACDECGLELRFTPAGKLFTSSSGVRLFDPTRPRPAPIDIGGRAAFSRDGRYAAVGYADGSVLLRDAANWKRIARLGDHPPNASEIAFSWDSRTVATVGDGPQVKLWDVPTRQLRRTLAVAANGVYSIAFAPDRPLLAAGSSDGTVTLWDTESDRPPAVLSGHEGIVSCIAFSPQGDLLATAGHDKIIKIWNPRTEEHLATLRGHIDQVRVIEFSPDGKTLASGSDDRTVRLWSVATHEELLRLDAHSVPVDQLSFTPDGQTLATGGSDSDTNKAELFLWQAPQAPGM